MTFKLTTQFSPKGDQPQAIAELEQGLDARGPRPGPARHHRLGQDVHDRQRHREIAATDAHPRPQQDARRPALRRDERALRGATPSSTSSATTTTTSPRRTSRRATRTSTRTPSSTTPSTGCVTRRRTRSCRGATSSSSRASRCIYGIGSAESYYGLLIDLKVGEEFPRDRLLRMLVDVQYERNDVDFHRGTFRVRGDVVEVFPAYEQETAIRIEFFGDTVEAHQGGRPAARPREGHGRARRHLPRARTTSRRRSRCAAPSARSARSSASGSTSSTRRAASSRSSASSSGRSTTSR